jgi:hypothetical protein
MPPRLHTPYALVLGLMLASVLACAGAAPAKQRAAAPTWQWKDGRLALLSGGKVQALSVKSPVPYRIVSSSNAYSLLTTCDSDLSVVTYSTDGVNVRAFRDMLLVLRQGPVCALQGLASTEAGGATGTVLLGSRGEEVWRDVRADLLWPVTGEPRRDAFCISQGADTNPLGIYCLQPALARVALPAGNEMWRASLLTDEYVEDAIIYGIGGKYGLLCLQYGVDLYEFFTFELATGATRSVKLFDGVPAYTSIYPGPIPYPAGVELNGDILSVVAHHNQRGWLRLVFNLAAGTVKEFPGTAPPALAERNPHPDGGQGAPKPPLFPQGILPTQSGNAWTIPALLNAKGQVFVATSSGASWVTP